MTRPAGILVTYNGTTYRIDGEHASQLIAAGVIVPDDERRGEYRLDIHHVIDEIEAYATPVDRGPTNDDRGPGMVEAGKRRMLAVRFGHRDGQGR